MTFTTEVAKSVSDPRILVDLDIGQLNVQWVNNGAGIWVVDALNVYEWVDDTLLDGFTAQEFDVIGSVNVDGIQLTEVDTLGEVTTSPQSFFYDKDGRRLTIRIVDYDEPGIHDIWIGVIYGYSFDEFTPDTGAVPYEGRLLGAPSVSISRDPLFYGKITYGGGSVVINNADGDLDTLAEENDIYGNAARIYFGYKDIQLSTYTQLFTGYIGRISTGELRVPVQIQDIRKQLTREITVASTTDSATNVIRDILVDNFSAVYNDTYFNTTSWSVAATLAEDVTLDMVDASANSVTRPAIEVIEQICLSTFGLFIIDPDGRYNFKIVDTSVTADTTIFAHDIAGRQSQIVYEPTEVVSSVKVGYGRDWATSGDQYTYITDETAEASVFTQYKTYKQQTFDTVLPASSAATRMATTFIDRFRAVHGRVSVEVPMAYYDLELADIINVEIVRPSGSGLVGTTKSEIIGLTYNLDRPTISVDVRFV